jgi:antitoxin PrlF
LVLKPSIDIDPGASYRNGVMAYYGRCGLTAVSKLTSKYQATIPKEVREALGLSAGDMLRFETLGGQVLLRRATPLDLAYLEGVEAGLSEWESEADEEAYRDL